MKNRNRRIYLWQKYVAYFQFALSGPQSKTTGKRINKQKLDFFSICQSNMRLVLVRITQATKSTTSETRSSAFLLVAKLCWATWFSVAWFCFLSFLGSHALQIFIFFASLPARSHIWCWNVFAIQLNWKVCVGRRMCVFWSGFSFYLVIILIRNFF